MADRPRRRVGERINPLRVVCRRCGETPWEGDEPVEAPRQLLADFADSSCPLGGTTAGCPSTTEAQETEREAQPLTRIERLREIVDTISTAIQTNRDDITTLKQQRTALAGRVTTLEQENTALKARVTALEQRPPA
ncbi:MAG: hypothetical protein ACRDSL_04440 [Pseudonocardiaceae bacterium]